MGSHFVRHMYQKYPEYRIVNYDLLTYAGNNLNLQDIEEDAMGFQESERRYEFIKGDICDYEFLKKVFEKNNFAAVVNFAAESHVDRSIVDAHQFVRTNIQGVHVLIELVRSFRTPKFIQISTDEVFGDVPQGNSNEESPFQPSSPYSASKASADLLVQAFIRTHRVPAIILRSSNNFGPYQYPEKLMPLAISSFLDGEKLPVHGSGEHERSWIYVNDFCRALDLVMHEARPHTVYNISGTPMKNLEVIRAIASLLGKNPRDHIVHTSDRPGADLRYAPECSKIQRELKWAPVHDFGSALIKTVAWYENNRDWWQTIKQSEVFRNHFEKQSKAQYY